MSFFELMIPISRKADIALIKVGISQVEK